MKIHVRLDAMPQEKSHKNIIKPKQLEKKTQNIYIFFWMFVIQIIYSIPIRCFGFFFIVLQLR